MPKPFPVTTEMLSLFYSDLFVDQSQVPLPPPNHIYTQTPLNFNSSLPSSALDISGLFSLEITKLRFSLLFKIVCTAVEYV